MLFNSYIFLFVFLPATLVGFYLVSRLGARAGALWLAVASLAFYSYWNPKFLILLICSIAFNYAVGEAIHVTEKKPRLQNWLLIGGIVANLGALFYYKYLESILQFVERHGGPPSALEHVLLPLGISFFTFTQIGYLIDSKQGATKARGPVNYVLFVTFFPHLLAGPILHNREMMPQFADKESYRFRPDNIAAGLAIFTIGLLKKSLIADSLSPDVAQGFSQASSLGFWGAWNTALCYSLQLYFDFSGYSDMAIGIARMFNITFPANFNSPYKARNIIDFWQRWHMTLTRYLTLFLYNPIALAIARRRAAKGLDITRKANATPSGFFAMVLFPTVTTMGIAGVWHGAGWQFLIFGLLHGFYLTINHGWRVFGPKGGPPPASAAGRIALDVSLLLFTYLCVLLAEVFFRAASVANAVDLLKGMAGFHGLGAGLSVPPGLPAKLGSLGRDLVAQGVLVPSTGDAIRHIVWMVILFAIIWLAPNSQEIMARTKPVLGKVTGSAGRFEWRPSLAWGLVFGLALAFGVLSVSGTREFLYFQF